MNETLRALAAETAAEEASPTVRAALLTELAKRREEARPVWQIWSLRLWPAAAAAICLAAGFWFGIDREPKRAIEQAAQVAPPVELPAEAVEPAAAAPAGVDPEVRPAVRRASAGAPIEFAAVTPWYFHAGLPAPATARVVRTQVSVATAQHFGVIAGGSVAEAEILMGDDGLARAIRFLQPVRRNPVLRASSRQE